MLIHLLDWLELLARWLHIVVGAAWIGASFYFNWLNNSLRSYETTPDEIAGELWAVHGGGFYQVSKYKLSPESMAGPLHWFKWEAYFTWMSGIVLLALVYYLGADGFLLDGDSDLTRGAGIGVGIASLVGGWIVYHLLCNSPLRDRPTLLTCLIFLGTIGVAYGLTQTLSARAAFIHVGAMLGTCMAANVFFVIIPGQKAMVDALTSGRTPDAAKGKAGALRSLHNNYFTLPVLFVMIRTHYPVTYGHDANWAVLAGIFAAGVAVRHSFNVKGQGRKSPLALPAGLTALAVLIVVTAPESIDTNAPQVNFQTQVLPIVHQRCTPCHAKVTTYEGIAVAQGGVYLETASQIKAESQRILKHAVLSHYMPLGNLTKITEEERALLGHWIRSGAQVEEGTLP